MVIIGKSKVKACKHSHTQLSFIRSTSILHTILITTYHHVAEEGRGRTQAAQSEMQ